MNQEIYIVYLFLFAILAYFVVTDNSVATFVVLLTKWLSIQTQRVYYLIKFHPIVTNNIISRYFMMRKYLKISKSIERGEK